MLTANKKIPLVNTKYGRFPKILSDDPKSKRSPWSHGNMARLDDETLAKKSNLKPTSSL